MRPYFLIFIVFWLFSILTPAYALQEWNHRSYKDFIEGEIENLSITSQGELMLAPQITEIFDTGTPQIWCAVSDKAGNVYLGTGPTGKVFKVDANGKGSEFFDSEELQISALALAANGDLFVATSPDGKVYRIKPDQSVSVYFDPEDTYIWSLLADKNGNLYSATGNSGKVYKITAENKATVLYESGEFNITVMAFDDKENIILGTDGKGYVIRLSPKGDVFVLFDTPLRQVHALAVAKDGTIYAGAIDDNAPFIIAPVPPPATAPSQTPGEQNQNDDSPENAGAEGSEQNVPISPIDLIAGADRMGDHAVYKISPNGFVQKVRVSQKNVTMSLTLGQDDQLIIGTGENGKFFNVDDRGKLTLLNKIKDSQITAFTRDGKGRLLACSSNLGKLYRIEDTKNSSGTYTSLPLDAKMAARWGRIAWDGTLGNNVKITTRSGNTEEANENWSDWSQPYTDHNGVNITSPAARFIQYKLEFSKSGSTDSPLINNVSIVCKQQNMAPVIRAISLNEAGEGGSNGNQPIVIFDSGNEISSGGSNLYPPQTDNKSQGKKSMNGNKSKQPGIQAVRWIANDDNEDNLIYNLYFKGIDETIWKELKKDYKSNSYTWTTTQMPDGKYHLKIVVSDKPDNPYGEALMDSLESSTFIVDNTPPILKDLAPKVEGTKVHLTFTVKDELSSIDRVEYAINLGDWETLSPLDHICDAYEEKFDFTTEMLNKGEQYILIRLTDDQENQKVFKQVVNIP